MTQLEVIEAPITKSTLQDDLTHALIACGGDIKLVAERFSRNGREVSAPDVLQAFIDKANETKTQDAMKAMILLGFLELLTNVKEHMISGMAEFAPTELQNTMKLIVDGMTQLMAPANQPQQASNPINIIQQFLQQSGADQARSTVETRLREYHENDTKYGSNA